ncbi:MAG: branched-chain amino acid ABC transporter permease [Pantoea sp.]|uniref:ABC transporter permease subunit n=1 Tax=Pantoea sp. TaxID=69393 RepID=UPI0023A13C6C|nr:branched-chain amino acid ABC transporter permease [Pantoea sp.]MDE1185427.1 branched-chain amino acid ABC transporter permease [Pantoea sp.]
MKLTSTTSCNIAALITGMVVLLVLPAVMDLYSLINATIYVSLALFALSMALIWGHAGILCFGQSMFFGLGAYGYAVAGINFGDSTWAVPIAIATPMLFALILGYFVFYGRLSDIYFGVITLTVTLILFKLANSTSGDAWHIGKARLGGFNGMPDTPPLNMPFNPAVPLSPDVVFMVAVCALVAGYMLCKWLVGSRFGRAVAGVRENEARAELLGYDSRRIKLYMFAIGAGLAGLAGCLFANSVFVSPTVFSLSNSAQVLIWVVVGGVGTLLGPILACLILQGLTAYLGTLGWIDPNIVLGSVLILFVLLLPKGLLPTLLERLPVIRARTPSATVVSRS